MSKVAVIFWSGSGNTAAMAQAVAEGAKAAGAETELFQVPQISASEAASYDRLALGCPAMGAEVLEESEFEPFFTELEGHLGGRRVALFGSYGSWWRTRALSSTRRRMQWVWRPAASWGRSWPRPEERSEVGLCRALSCFPVPVPPAGDLQQAGRRFFACGKKTCIPSGKAGIIESNESTVGL